jgi:hypothetical protein
MYDVVIIGAGPTGLIAAKESLKYKKKVLLVDKGNGGNYPYLPFSSPATEEKIVSERLGGIGGTSNSWHGQGLKFPKKYFENYFLDSKFWSYPKYLELSKQVEKLFGMNINESNKVTRFRRLRKKISSIENISLQVSHIPSYLPSWKSIFNSVLKSRDLVYLKDEVDYLLMDENKVTRIALKSSNDIEICNSTLVVLSTNALGSIKILLKSEEMNSLGFPGIGMDLYDHPHLEALKFDISGNRVFITNTFSYLLLKAFRIKLKKKFVVEHEGEEIGIFEINLKYKENDGLILFIRILHKILRLFFGYSFRSPEFVSVWIQIEQNNNGYKQKDRIFVLEKNELFWKFEVNSEDHKRFKIISRAAIEMLNANGFNLEENLLDNPKPLYRTAAHPSGTVSVGYNPKLHTFNFEGLGNVYQNLMISGSALIGTGSWVNPTLPIMTLTLGNIRNYFDKKME